MLFNGHNTSFEQDQALYLFKTMQKGEVLSLMAGAGAAKTYTCNYLLSVGSPNSKALVIAFNNLIIQEMRDAFPENVDVMTTHELARRYVKGFSDIRLKRPLTPRIVIDELGLVEKVCGVDSRRFSEKLINLVTKFASDSATSLSTFIQKQARKLLSTHELSLVPQYTYYAEQLWSKMLDRQATIPVLHDVYLKEFVLSVVRGEIQLDYDIVVLDEAQDSAPIVKLLFDSIYAKKVSAGDKYQSIYEWRGAINVMEHLAKTAHYTSTLTTNYRYGQDIADLSNSLIEKYYGKNPSFKGNPNKVSSIIQTTEARSDKQQLWLFRTNAELMSELVDASLRGITCHLLKDNKEMLKLLKQAKKLFDGYSVREGNLAGFRSWAEFEEFASSPTGGEFKSFLNAINQYGFGEIERVLRSSIKTKAADAQLLFATAHSCKGIEADHVVLHSDFDKCLYRASGRALLQEVNLLYVALTRAKMSLDISKCKSLIDIIKKASNAINIDRASMNKKQEMLEALGL